jgi:GAF domain-containing protein
MSTEWDFLVALNERLRPLNGAVEIQDAAVRLVGERLHANRVHYARIEEDKFVLTRSFDNGLPPFARHGAVAFFGAAIVDACRHGETVAINDVHTDPRFTPDEREQLLAAAVTAFVAVPLIKGGRWLGVFCVHGVAPRIWTRDHIALIEMAAQRTWGAGERARAEEALGRSDNRQAFLRHLNDTIRPMASPGRALDEACRLLGNTSESTESRTATSRATTASSSASTSTDFPRSRGDLPGWAWAGAAPRRS